MNTSWKETPKGLTKEFVCDSFLTAVEVINRIAPLAEERNHHPDIELFSYNHLRITLFTHDANAITEKDHELAEAIDSAYTI